ncbi:MAG TPA: helix-turn-helix transcriptional regulator [Desulfatiglandales bacterium]|nr:helix-turn-helix transcriptional regulator [Desulfatiglandales bacterium]
MDKGLQIKQVAQALNVSSDSVINWELRGRKPRYRHIAMLKRVLAINLPVSLLYKGYPIKAVTIGQKIKQKRLELSLSQKELARMLKVNKDTIKDWEDDKGMKKPLASSLKKIRRFLGVNR